MSISDISILHLDTPQYLGQDFLPDFLEKHRGAIARCTGEEDFPGEQCIKIFLGFNVEGNRAAPVHILTSIALQYLHRI